MISATDTLPTMAAELPIGARGSSAAACESTYAWNLETDALHWAPDAADCLGVASMAPLTTGRQFAARLVPESMASREKVILTGAHDPGTGVAYQASYGLIGDPDDRDAAIVWLDDRGRWYAGADGHPARAEGRVRRITLDLGAAAAETRSALVGRAAFLEHVERKLAALGRPPTPFALLVGGFRNAGDDDALAVVVDLLRIQMRARDVLASLTADRLALLLEACDPDQMTIAADRFLAVLEAPATAGFRFGGVVVPRDGRSGALLIAQADRALSTAFTTDASRFVAHTPAAE